MKKLNKKILFAILLIIAFCQLFPLYWLITFSLKSNAEIFGENVLGLPRYWLWENYATALNDGGILRYFINSIIYTGLTVIIVGVLTSMSAYAIARMKWKSKDLVFSIFTLGIMIPTQAALLPLFQVIDKLGLKGGYLGLLIPYVAFGIPMSVMILTGFYKGIPREMEEAAYIDGCEFLFCYYYASMIRPWLQLLSLRNLERLCCQYFGRHDVYHTSFGIMSFADNKPIGG